MTSPRWTRFARAHYTFPAMHRPLRAMAVCAVLMALAASPDDRTSLRPGGSADPDGGKREETGRPGPYPADWFMVQRAFPSGEIAPESYEQAVERADLDRALGAYSTTTAGINWQPAGPYNIGGRVTALAVAPGGSLIYLGSANGGVFKSADGGINWTPVFERYAAYSIGAIALYPGNPNQILVGTGEANSSADSYDGNGLYRSHDAGDTWEFVGLQKTRRIARVAVDPSESNRIFVAAMGSLFTTSPDRGLYRTQDGGKNWSKVLFVSDSTGCCDVVINPAHPETVFCATWERVRRVTYRRAYGPECKIWRSVDHGTTWTALSSGLPAPSENVGRIALALAPSRPSTIYAQIGSGLIGNYTGLGLYRSQNGGATWTRRDVGGSFTGGFGGFVWYFGDMAVDPTNPDKIYCLGVSLLRSLDGGVSFNNIAGLTHPDQHAIWIDPGNPQRVFLGNDGGFFSTVNGAVNWTKSVDLPISQFYAGSIDASDPSRLVGGTQDNGTLFTNGSPTAWAPTSIGGDGFYFLVDPVSPDTMFAEYQNCSNGNGVLRAVSGPIGFSGTFGFNPSDRYNWCTPFTIDPSDHMVLLCGSQRVYKSTNNGQDWVAVSGDLTNFPNPSASLTYHTITTLDISPVTPATYYAGTDDGRVWRSLDGGGIWTDITAGLPARWVTRVTADPFDAQTVYVTLSGFTQDEHAVHVYRSTQNGAAWASIAGDLPNVPANDLLVDPTDPQRLYLATDVGVYTSQNLGASWYPLGQGMPTQVVADLTLHPGTRTLVAATHGRSQWTLDLNALPTAAPAPARPARLALSPPTPNPSRGVAQLTLEVMAASGADVVIYDAAGRRVRDLFHGVAPGGREALAWDGRDERGARVAAGVYFVRAIAGGVQTTRRLVRVD